MGGAVGRVGVGVVTVTTPFGGVDDARSRRRHGRPVLRTRARIVVRVLVLVAGATGRGRLAPLLLVLMLLLVVVRGMGVMVRRVVRRVVRRRRTGLVLAVDKGRERASPGVLSGQMLLLFVRRRIRQVLGEGESSDNSLHGSPSHDLPPDRAVLHRRSLRPWPSSERIEARQPRHAHRPRLEALS